MIFCCWEVSGLPPTSPNGSSAPSCVTGRWTPKYSRASGVAEASVLAYVGLLVYDVGFYMLFPYSHDCCDCISSSGLCTLVYSCFFESPKCLRCLRNRESSFYCCNGELSLTTSVRRCTARCELKGTRPSASWCGQLCSCANSTHPNL